jgi:glucuronoxylan 4-O-methyltransferase
MIRFFFAKLSIELAIFWPSHFNILVMKKLNGIQLSSKQLKVIVLIIKEKVPCRLLIFGLGNDSAFWFKLNKGGITIFLEDNTDWFQIITQRIKNLTAFMVNYNTKINDWDMLLKFPSLLDMNLPTIVEKEKWDVIIVDAPSGWNDQSPGRMKSIYLSSRLIKYSGDIFVHDCNREVESIYCNRFLKENNLQKEIKASGGFLRHYKMKNCTT